MKNRHKLSRQQKRQLECRRKALGLSQTDLARCLDITQGAYSQKVGDAYPCQGFTVEQLLAICGLMDMRLERDLGIQLPNIRETNYDFFYVLRLMLNGRKLTKIGVTNDPSGRFTKHEKDYEGYAPTMLLIVESTNRGVCASLESQLLAVYGNSRKNLPRGIGEEVLGVDPERVIQDVLRLTNVFPQLHDVTQVASGNLVGLVRPDRHKLQ